MKVLLVNTNREHAPQPVVPLGVCMLAAALERGGLEPQILDLAFARRPLRDLARSIETFAPAAIGLSIRNLDNGEFMAPRSYLPFAVEVARECRRHSTAPLIIGGPAVSIAPRQLLEMTGADWAVAGEGEEILPQLLEHLRSDTPPPRLPGLYRRDDSAITGDGAARITGSADLRALPRAEAGRRVDLKRYLRWGSPLPVQSKRGCALPCIHCTYRLVEGEKYRFRPPDEVADEIVEMNAREGVRRFEFVDSTFNHPPRHALELCEAIIRRGIRAEFYTMGLNPAGTSRELMGLMKRAGFLSALCSPDSGSEKMLGTLRKGFDAAQVERTAYWAQEAGISILWSYIFGGPGESKETAQETISFIERATHRRDRVICTLGLRVYPDTELAAIAKGEGALDTEANLVGPAFYFSKKVSHTAIMHWLESSAKNSQIVYLGLLQERCVPWALRLRAALHLPGSLWAGVPLYNRMMRRIRAR